MENHVYLEFEAGELRQQCEYAMAHLELSMAKQQAILDDPKTSDFHYASASDRLGWMVKQKELIEQIVEAIHASHSYSKVMISGIAEGTIHRWAKGSLDAQNRHDPTRTDNAVRGD